MFCWRSMLVLVLTGVLLLVQPHCLASVVHLVVAANHALSCRTI
jgi:hypothetical protein